MSEKQNSDTSLLAEMRTYSHTRILNTIKQSNHFSEEVVENAKIIFKERGLGDEAQMEMIEKSRKLEKKAFDLISRGSLSAKVKEYLLNNGMDERTSNLILINNAAKLKEQKEQPKSQNKRYYLFLLFLFIFALKMILRSKG